MGISLRGHHIGSLTNLSDACMIVRCGSRIEGKQVRGIGSIEPKVDLNNHVHVEKASMRGVHRVANGWQFYLLKHPVELQKLN